MECYCYLRHVLDHPRDGKTPHARRCGEPFCGPRIPLGSMVECHPIPAKDQARLHQFGEKGPNGHFRWLCVVRGEGERGEEGRGSGKEIFWSRTLRGWKTWKRQESFLGDSSKGDSHAKERGRNRLPFRRWKSQVDRKRSRSPNIHPDSEPSQRRGRI